MHIFGFEITGRRKKPQVIAGDVLSLRHNWDDNGWKYSNKDIDENMQAELQPDNQTWRLVTVAWVSIVGSHRNINSTENYFNLTRFYEKNDDGSVRNFRDMDDIIKCLTEWNQKIGKQKAAAKGEGIYVYTSEEPFWTNVIGRHNQRTSQPRQKIVDITSAARFFGVPLQPVSVRGAYVAQIARFGNDG